MGKSKLYLRCALQPVEQWTCGGPHFSAVAGSDRERSLLAKRWGPAVCRVLVLL